jgi:hypothetical protein
MSRGQGAATDANHSGVARSAQAATRSARRYAPSLRAQPLTPHQTADPKPEVVHFSTGTHGPLFNRP